MNEGAKGETSPKLRISQKLTLSHTNLNYPSVNSKIIKGFFYTME